MRITRCFKLISWLLCAALLVGSWLPGAHVAADQGPQLAVLDGEEVILGHLADEHLDYDAPESIEYERLREALRVMKRMHVDLLISTGDLTEANTAYTYETYNEVLGQVGGYSRYPSYGAGIPFRPVAGNHDYYGISPWPQHMGPSQHSLTIGNYRFIGFSGDPNKDLPVEWLESEMQKSCRDGKWIVLYHHYPPNGWMPAELDMSAESWAKIDVLAQKYPVVAYLAGHNHQELVQAMSPGYFVHTAGRLGAGYYTVYSLRNGTVNMNNMQGNVMAPLVTTYPVEYHEGLDYTKTRAEMTKVRAYVRTDEGQISEVSYKLDGGTAVIMQRVGTTNYYEAALNASGLSGEHTIAVTAKHSYGAWASASHQITSYFAATVPERDSAGCENVPTSIDIPLSAGWNLVSIPFAPSSNALVDTLSPIAGKHGVLYAYDATDTVAPWSRYIPDAPAILSDFKLVDERQGWWVEVSEPVTLTISGTTVMSTEIPLSPGWNLVGYPKQWPQDIGEALASIAGECECVYAYDAARPDDPWQVYDVQNPLAPGSLTQMEPGRGYWIYVTGAATWTVE